MTRFPVHLTPTEARTLAQCGLHYHFARQTTPPANPAQVMLDGLLRETIQTLHAGGGPTRLSLDSCLANLAQTLNRITLPPDSSFNINQARPMIENYYHRLAHDWAQVIAGNELLELKLSLAGIPVTLEGTVDRLDRTRDGGILAIFFRTEAGPLPLPANLLDDPALTLYHALVAANYPHKRPVRLQEWWLQLNQGVTIELSEAEYRHNLGLLREPIQALARGEVRARPGLHCEACYFKQHGCPVYAHQNNPDDLAATPPAGKISSRQWTFKI